MSACYRFWMTLLNRTSIDEQKFLANHLPDCLSGQVENVNDSSNTPELRKGTCLSGQVENVNDSSNTPELRKGTCLSGQVGNVNDFSNTPELRKGTR